MNTRNEQHQDQPTPPKKRPGAPKGNQNGRRHGLYSRLYPVDFVDTFERLQREQGRPPLDPKAAMRLAAVTRDPRMSKRLLADTVSAMRTLITFERTVKRLQQMRSR